MARTGPEPGRKRPPQVCECGSVGWVVLTRGYVAIIDSADLPAVAKWSWRAFPKGGPGRRNYVGAIAKIDGRTVPLGRYLLNNPAGLVDHKSGQEWDFRRANLRVATFCENAQNRAKQQIGQLPFKGLEYRKQYKYRPWIARIRADGRDIFLGNFATPEEAAAAYDAGALKYHGAFARTNAR